MHALLACTALHMAYLNPKQRSEFTVKARSHQDHAIPLFRAAVPSIESETCDAILVFARVVTITAFALDEPFSTVEENEDKLPSWLFFIRSGCKLLTLRNIPVLFMGVVGVVEWIFLVEKQSKPGTTHYSLESQVKRHH